MLIKLFSDVSCSIQMLSSWKRPLFFLFLFFSPNYTVFHDLMWSWLLFFPQFCWLLLDVKMKPTYSKHHKQIKKKSKYLKHVKVVLCIYPLLHSQEQKLTCFICFVLFFRCLFGSLLHPPHHHRHPTLLLGAGGGSEDPTWEYRSVELCLSSSGRDRDVKSDGKDVFGFFFFFFLLI